MMFTRIGSVMVLVVLLSSRAALAQPSLTPPITPPIEPTVVVDDYRWKLIVADLGSLGVAIAVQQPSIELIGFPLISPIIHLFHQNTSGALTSLGLRAGLPTIGMLLGAAAGEERCRMELDGGGILCGLEEVAAGVLIGMSTAMIIDWAFLGRKTTTVHHSALIRAGNIAATPVVNVSPTGSIHLGLGGTF